MQHGLPTRRLQRWIREAQSKVVLVVQASAAHAQEHSCGKVTHELLSNTERLRT